MDSDFEVISCSTSECDDVVSMIVEDRIDLDLAKKVEKLEKELEEMKSVINGLMKGENKCLQRWDKVVKRVEKCEVESRCCLKRIGDCENVVNAHESEIRVGEERIGKCENYVEVLKFYYLKVYNNFNGGFKWF